MRNEERATKQETINGDPEWQQQQQKKKIARAESDRGGKNTHEPGTRSGELSQHLIGC